MIGQNTTHANFSVDDLAVAKDFYVNKLGFQIKNEHDGDIMLESGAGTRVNIYFKEDHIAWNATVLGIEVDNLNDVVDELVELGVSVEKLPGTDDKGIMRDTEMGDAAWFKDPAGNWICIGNWE